MSGAVDDRNVELRLTPRPNKEQAAESTVDTVFEIELTDRLETLELAVRSTIYFRESDGVPVGFERAVNR